MPVRSGDQKAIVACETIEGVFSVGLDLHGDPRGALTEIFRPAWIDTPQPRQWSLIRSVPNTLRGIHVHVRHGDYIVEAHRRTIVGLKDLRRDSRTWLKDARYVLDADAPCLLHIPPGVAHGFHSPTGSLMCLGTTHTYDPADELGYRWDDPAGLLFPEVEAPLLSERDARAQPLADLLAQLEPHQRGFSL